MFRKLQEDVVEIVETLPVKKGVPAVIFGFAGPGFIGNTAVMYVVRNKGFRQRAHLRSNLVPPMMLVLDGRPEHSMRIYSSEKEDVLLAASELMFTTKDTWRVGERLMDWLVSKGVKDYISIEGMPFASPTKERTVLGFSTEGDPSKHGVQTIKEGAVTGLNACLLELCMSRKLPWTSLLVPTNLLSAVDYGGTAAAIEVLNRMFKFGMDAEPLKQRDEMLRQAFEKQAKSKPSGFLGSLGRRT